MCKKIFTYSDDHLFFGIKSKHNIYVQTNNSVKSQINSNKAKKLIIVKSSKTARGI